MEPQLPLSEEPMSAELSYASLKDRVQAVALDSTLILVLAFLIFSGLDNLGYENGQIKPFIFIFLFVLYDPLLIAFWGGTIGHKMVGIKVKRLDDPDRNISILMAFLRFATKVLLGWISLLTITGNEERRAIHDFLGLSVVLKG